MILKQLTINTTHEASELVADILYNISNQGVNIYDKEDLIELISSQDFWDYVDKEELEKSEIVQVKAYFNPDEVASKMQDVEKALEELKKNSCFPLGSLEMILDDVDSDLWWENWKKTYKPIDAGKIMIVPNWINETFDNKIVIKMDPGMAFGSGEHASTRMCLTFLQETDLSSKSLVDVGCGSGILAISAKALGAKDVEAYDIDDVAVSAAKKNACLNGFKDIKVENSNLLDKSDKTYDVVVANITSEVLKMLAKDLEKYVKIDGVVIISGILTSLEDDVLQAFTKLGFRVLERKCEGEWVAFKLSK
ncbi:MAG: 50S ribosomal protein L11 methyltransferase [Clostridia bacterium]|nr:50S ribosomal protein L11 methyltransferase [Clostridia bacterium]